MMTRPRAPMGQYSSRLLKLPTLSNTSSHLLSLRMCISIIAFELDLLLTGIREPLLYHLTDHLNRRGLGGVIE